MAGSQPEIITFTISSGSSLSDAHFIGDRVPLALYVPTIDSAKLTFQASISDSTYYDVYDATNSEAELPATTGDRVFDAPDALRGVNYMKIRSGSSGSAATQSAERTIEVVCK